MKMGYGNVSFNGSIIDLCLSDHIEARNLLFIVMISILLTVSLIGNILAIAVIFLTNQLRERHNNLLIVSLAVADIGVTVFILPLRIHTYTHNQSFCYSAALCRYLNIIDTLFHFGSISNLFLISLDRFCAIHKPLHYFSMVRKHHMVISITVVWTYSILWTFLGIINWHDPSLKTLFNQMIVVKVGRNRICKNVNEIYYLFVYIIGYIIPLFIMAFIYAYIFKAAYEQSRRIACMSSTYGVTRRNVKKVKRYDLRAAKTVGIVYSAFLICWLPVTILTITSTWCPECFRDFRLHYPSLFKFTVALFIEFLPALNSCLNPFIYLLFNRQFRTAYKEISRKYFRVEFRRATPYSRSLSESQSRENIQRSRASRETNSYELSELQQQLTLSS